MRFAEIDGTTIAYRISGDPKGQAVIFVNPLGADLTIWDEVVERIPRGYAAIGFDKRGHGLSPLTSKPASGSLRIDDYASDLLGLADHIGLDGFVVCGVSMGGMIAQAAAVKANERFRGLVLCNTGAKIGAPETWNDRIAAVEANGLEPLADAVMERWFPPEFRNANPALLAGCRAMLTRTPREGYAAACAAIRDADLAEAASRLAVPTLCIAGADDLATPPTLVGELAELIPDACYREIADCGHIPSVQQPEECARAISEFLSGLESPSTVAGGAAAPESSAHARGMRVRRKVLGDAHVDHVAAQTTELDRRFQAFIAEGAWGAVWAGDRFTLRERSIVTLALLAALGNDEEVAMHLRATANTGASLDDVSEALLHVAVYAGVPRANRALKIAREVFAQDREKE